MAHVTGNASPVGTSMKPGDDYVGTGKDGRPIPPPKTCPECGAKTTRKGNRGYREVACVCGWQHAVDRLSAWHSCFNPVETKS
jgi:hypothetical protein